MAEPVAVDWAALLQQSAMLLVQAAAWTFVTRAIVYALGLVGR